MRANILVAGLLLVPVAAMLGAEAAAVEKAKIVSIAEIKADLPAPSGFAKPLKLIEIVQVELDAGRRFIFSLHRSEEHVRTLAAWTNADGGHRRLFELKAGLEGWGILSPFFLKPLFFKLQRRQFVYLARQQIGTAHVRETFVYRLNPDGTVDEVEYVSPHTSALKRIRRGEYIFKSEEVLLTQGKLTFMLLIWKEDEPNCCPSGGKIVGPFKIVENKSGATAPALKMVADGFYWKPESP